MNVNGSAIGAPFTSATPELRAKLNRMLVAPVAESVESVDLNLTGAELAEAEKANREWIFLGVLLESKAAGLDDTAAVEVTTEFMSAFDARIAAYTASLIGGAR